MLYSILNITKKKKIITENLLYSKCSSSFLFPRSLLNDERAFLFVSMSFPSQIGFLRRDKDGTTTLAVVNPVDSEGTETLEMSQKMALN